MTKSTITRERAQQIFLGNGPEPSASEERELARMALAAMDSESGCLPLDYLQGHKDGLEWAAQLAEANHPETGDWLYDDPIELAKAIRKGPDMPPVQPVEDSDPDRNPVLAYADSYRDMAKQGVESVPIWSVITDLERNIAPLYRHAQPAPEKYNIGDATMRHIFTPTGMTNVSDMQAVFDRVEAVLVGMERTAPEYPEVLPCPVLLGPWLRFGKGIKTSTMLAALARRAVYESDMAALSPEEIAEFQARIEDFKALIAQPAPVVPDSYVMVPMRLTAENGAKGALSGEFSETKFVNCPECFGDEECETCDGSGKIEITVPVTWTTIKEIWAKGVEHFAAAPQGVK
ncbi:TPA: hypothetical protein ACT92S_001256 [Klebsiella pneumoniae]